MKTSGNSKSSSTGGGGNSMSSSGNQKKKANDLANSTCTSSTTSTSTSTSSAATYGNGNENSGNGSGGQQNGSSTEIQPAISNKVKAEAIEADREAFFSAFEKPTQIYRFMRTRMLHSPVYLERTLSYMKERMSRTNAARKTFKVDSLLKIVQKKLEDEQKERRLNGVNFGKSANQQNFYNIIFLGFSDPTHNWSPDAKAKVEIRLARVCMKKRKEMKTPIKKAFDGFCDVKMIPSSTLPIDGMNQQKTSSKSTTSTATSVTNKCSVISIPSDRINLVNGHVVRSYVMMVKVSVYQSYLMKPFTNGGAGGVAGGLKLEGSSSTSNNPNNTLAVMSDPLLSKKLASVSVKRLSLANNSTLNTTSHHQNYQNRCGGSSNSSGNSSRASSSEIDFQRNERSSSSNSMNPKVVVVKQELIEVGQAGASSASATTTKPQPQDEDDFEEVEQPKLKRRRSNPAARDSEQFIYPGVGGGSNTLGCRDTSDDQISFIGQITIYDKQSNIQLTNADYDLVLCQSQRKRPLLSFSKLMKQEASWEILDSNHPKVNTLADGADNDKPKLKLALRISQTKLGPFVDPPIPLASASNKNKGKSGSTNSKTDDDEMEHENTTKVIYRFLYNNNSRQQTEARDDLRCPWCSLNCFKLYSLLKHLKLCHTRFHFAYVPVPNGARIDVSINESFDGSYSGSAYDLVTQPPGEAFARNGPTKRTSVFQELVSKSDKREKLKQSLNEFLESEEKDLDQRRTYMTGHNRLYYHTTTCLPIHPKEIDVDSEGEPDPEWLQLKTSSMIDEFTDVNEGEKEVMKMWNLHVLKHNYVGDCQIPLACEMFVEYQGKEIIRRNLYRNFIIHLTSLFDFGLLAPDAMFNIVKKLQTQMKDNNSAGGLRETWKAHNMNTGTGPNFSQIKFDPPHSR